MAKFVIAGKCDCPFFARIELLADKLAGSLPEFYITKIIKQPSEWEKFLEWIKNKHGWNVQHSPIVWRELVNKGGKGCLIGGANEFQEFVAAYYNEKSFLTTNEMLDIVTDNVRFKNAEDADESFKRLCHILPLSVIIIGAGSPLTIYVLTSLLKGQIFGEDKLINVILYDEFIKTDDLVNLQSILRDSAFPNLQDVFIVTKLDEYIRDAKQIIILDVVPRLNSQVTVDEFEIKNNVPESREEWLKRRYSYFQRLGQLIKEKCCLSVRILLAGNPGLDSSSLNEASPLCFDMMALYKAVSPKVPSYQIYGLVGSVELRIKSVIAEHLNVHTRDISDVVIWGNIGSSIFVDLSRCRVFKRSDTEAGIVAGSWFSLMTLEVAKNPKWLQNQLVHEAIEQRSLEVPIYSGLSHGNSICEFLQNCWRVGPKNKGELMSMVLISENWYDIPRGVAFSFPVVLNSINCWSPVQDMQISETTNKELMKCLQSVLEDWAVVDSTLLENFLSKIKDTTDKETFEINEPQHQQG